MGVYSFLSTHCGCYRPFLIHFNNDHNFSLTFLLYFSCQLWKSSHNRQRWHLPAEWAWSWWRHALRLWICEWATAAVVGRIDADDECVSRRRDLERVGGESLHWWTFKPLSYLIFLYFYHVYVCSYDLPAPHRRVQCWRFPKVDWSRESRVAHVSCGISLQCNTWQHYCRKVSWVAMEYVGSTMHS